MILVCYYQETKNEGETEEDIVGEGLCLFDTSIERVHAFIDFERYNEDQFTRESVHTTTEESIFQEDKYFSHEIPNPDYEEDEDGNDNGEPAYIDDYTALAVFPLAQNTLHLLGFGPAIYVELYHMCLRYKLLLQAKSIKHHADKYVPPPPAEPMYGGVTLTRAIPTPQIREQDERPERPQETRPDQTTVGTNFTTRR